jgi:hypothetical protein
MEQCMNHHDVFLEVSTKSNVRLMNTHLQENQIDCRPSANIPEKKQTCVEGCA